MSPNELTFDKLPSSVKHLMCFNMQGILNIQVGIVKFYVQTTNLVLITIFAKSEYSDFYLLPAWKIM